MEGCTCLHSPTRPYLPAPHLRTTTAPEAEPNPVPQPQSANASQLLIHDSRLSQQCLAAGQGRGDWTDPKVRSYQGTCPGELRSKGRGRKAARDQGLSSPAWTSHQDAVYSGVGARLIRAQGKTQNSPPIAQACTHPGPTSSSTWPCDRRAALFQVSLTYVLWG